MEQLIRRCQQGDRAAMGQLYTAMHDELLAHCRKYAANDSTAEDLLHDAFLLIFSNIDKVRSPEKGRQWMHKVVRNVCLLYVQQQNRTFVPIDEARDTVDGREPDIAVAYDDILKAIDRLPLGYRQVFRLSVLEGLTHQQIAGLLGIEPHTSSSQLLRAKRQLRQLLKVLMAALLAVIPLGGYYFWSWKNTNRDVALGTGAGGSLQSPVPARSVEGDLQSPVPARPSANVDADSVPATNDTIVRTPQSENGLAEGLPLHQVDSLAQDQPQQDGLAQGLPLQEDGLAQGLPLHLSLAYSGLPDGTTRALPYGAEGMNGEIDSITHHRLPVTLALDVRYRLGPRWWLDGGLRYTLLSSETQVGNTYLYMEQQQRVRYLGLSLGVGYDLLHRGLHPPFNSRWSLYTTASVTCDLPLRSTVETSYWQGGRLIDSESHRLAPHAQWSVGLGMGLQYDLTPSVGVFAEPSLQYYFRNSDGISTWRTEHPFTPMLPFGVRVTF